MQIGFVLFPNVTQLDFTGPLQMLHRVPGATTHILARTLAPVPSDCGLGLVPTGTFAQAPALDMICVKLGRIVNGNPDYADNWVDIAGYAKLVSDRLRTGKTV